MPKFSAFGWYVTVWPLLALLWSIVMGSIGFFLGAVIGVFMVWVSTSAWLGRPPALLRNE